MGDHSDFPLKEVFKNERHLELDIKFHVKKCEPERKEALPQADLRIKF